MTGTNMLKRSTFRRVNVRLAFLGLLVLQLAACSSSEERAQSYYDRGMKLLAEHDNARASVELRNAVKLNKNLLAAWRGLAQIEELNRNWGGVIGNLRAVIELDPHDVDARIKLGKLLLLAGSLDEALKLVNDSDEVANQNADLRALKAAVLFRLNDSDGAVREAQAALTLDRGSVGAKMVIASDRLTRGDAKGALSMLESAPGDGRGDADTDLGVQLFKIRIFEQMGDLESVQGLLRKLVELYPQEPGFRKLLVKAFVDQNRNEDAEKELRALAAAHPTDVGAEMDLIRFLYTARKNPIAARQELLNRINAGGDVFTYQIALADMDFVEGKFTDGTQLLERLIGSKESTAEQVLTAKVTLARMHLSRKNLDAVEPLVAEILQKDNRNASGLSLRATIRLARGQVDAAVGDLRQALNDQPRSTDLMLMLAGAYERQGSIELAEKQFADATRASNFDPAVGLTYVAFLQRRGSGGRIEDVLNELASHQPNNIQILSSLAQVKLTRQDWVGAQEIADSIRRISNEGGIADQIRGAALIGQNKFEQSIAVFQNAYAAAPTAIQPMYALVRAYVAGKQIDRATAFLNSVLKANPSNAEALVLLGSIQLENRQSDQATKTFMTAIEKQPKMPGGYLALAGLYVSQKKDDEAQKALRAGLNELPDSYPLRLTLAGTFERKGDHEAAISEYEKLLDNQSGNLIVINNLASLLSDYRTDKASLEKAQLLAVSLRKSPIPQFKDTLGWISYREGNYKEAASTFEDAVAAMPNLAAVRYHLGMSYLALGRVDKASEQLKKALSLSPETELQAQIRAALEKIGDN
jgi:tetratricopeptide (TPR) repeat protein